MSPIDWVVFAMFLGWVVWDGARQGVRSRSSEDYLLAGRSMPWWAMGISILATQASAITMIGVVGQGHADGTRFLQFYFAMPLALAILAYTLLPLYHRSGVRTAYELLGRRFGPGTQRLAEWIFLLGRALGLGVILNAPALVLSVLLGWPRFATIGIMGAIAIGYTAVGGLRAVISTDVKQFAIMVVGLLVAAYVLCERLAPELDWASGFALARDTGHLVLLDTTFDPANKYTLWSALFGGTFLFLSYFGTDQSQVQRLLAGRSLQDERRAFLLTGLLKIPFQFLVLAIGVLLFLHGLFHREPVSFGPRPREAATAQLEARHRQVSFDIERAAMAHRDATSAGDAHQREVALGHLRKALEERRAVRAQVLANHRAVDELAATDTNYVFPHFLLDHFPPPFLGLLLAAIFAAALSSIDSELNSLATVSALRGGRATTVRAARWHTVGWGIAATGFALWVGRQSSLIEAVNRVGSFFYGALLGVFVLATAFPRVGGRGAIAALIAGMASTAIATQFDVAFLYLNGIGTLAAIVVGLLVGLTVHQVPGTRC